MKIVHIYAHNLQIFEDVLANTGCKINGSYDTKYLSRSFANFNTRDVMGLIVFRQHLTKGLLRLIKTFDETFVFSPHPIIVISDDATELVESKILRVKYSKLFVLDSMEGTISDIDLRRVFTTLACESDDMYELREVERAHASMFESTSKVSVEAQNDAVANAKNILKQLKKMRG